MIGGNMAQFCIRKAPEEFYKAARGLSQPSGERGFNLILIGLALFVMIGMVGLAIDIGRMFVYKSELQTFADNSAMAAIAKMDGTQAGVQAANALALTGPDGASLANKVNFDSTTISTVTTGYATSFSGTYDSYATASSVATNNYRFLKVVATQNVALTFLPVLPGISTIYAVSATAVSGQQATTLLDRRRYVAVCTGRD